MTIRTKLLIGALLLLLTVVGVAGYAVYGVNRISSLLTQTYDGALMASVHAEQAHTSFIKVDRALRNALASRTVDEFDRHVAAAESAAADVLSDLDVVAERKWSPEGAKLVGEIKALVAEKQTQRAALLPGLRQQLAGGSPASLVGVEPVTAAPGADTAPTGAARASSSGGQAPPEDSGVQIIRRKSADGKVTSPPSSGHQVPQVGGPSASGQGFASPRSIPGVPQVTAQAPAQADGPNVPAAPAGPGGIEGSPLVPQVGAPARSAGQPTAMPRVPQVAGSTSPTVRADASAPPAVAPPAATLAAATLAVSLFEGSEGIEAKLRALADRATEAGFVFRESSRGISRIILSVSIGALVAAILITGAAVFLFGRWIANPLGQVIQRLHSLVVGQGTLEQRLAATKELPVESADEIGQLRASFNATVTLLRQREGEVQRERRQEKELQESIGNFLNVANQIARGDLTKRGSVTNDSLGRVVESINRTVETLGTTVSDVQATSERVSTTAREMLVSSQRLATGAQAQSREATKAASALAGVTKSVRQVAGNATASANAARRALEAAREGEVAVRQSLEGMEGVQAEVEEITEKLKRLVDRSVEISEVVKTVKNIASQTELLALNASIEAAGAGEAGVRFAAVAGQIRKLADLASQAAKDVETLVQAVQVETQAAGTAMEQGTHRVEEGYQVSRQASALLQEIAQISQESAALAEDISVATQEQVRGTEGVAAAVQFIAGSAVQTEQSAVQAGKTVESLAGLAEALQAKLSQFKVKASSVATADRPATTRVQRPTLNPTA